MNNSADVFLQIRRKYDKFSKGHKKIADFILKNFDTSVFLTASNLGKEAHVSESTVVRFSYALGYDGYPSLQKDLQEMVKKQLTITQRSKLNLYNNGENKILESVMKKDMENIKQSLSQIDINDFDSIIEQILSCKGMIYIVGLRTSTSLSEYFAYYLGLMIENVKLIKYTYTDVFEQIVDINSDDMLIGISFPRYTTKTYDLMNYAKSKNANLIAITDAKSSPICEFADYSLIAVNSMSSIVDSLVAPLSLINAIIVSISNKKKEEVKSRFDAIEDIWRSQGVFK